ncbi:MAG: cyclic nucleotide-binding domain-containing protein [Candidatus Marinimicrobia bacterium]|nr:cyclic nucleotide-binding domain-containing protein [Candidatus Neomarinimicrobiota bacterium]
MAVVPTSSEAGLLRTRVPINTLSDEDRASLLEKISVKHIKRGEYLFRQGDAESKNVYLLSGRIDLVQDEKVVDTIADDLETARFALAHQFPRKFSARAKEPVEFVSIDSHLLSGLLSPAQVETDTTADADEDWMTQLLMSSVVQHIPPANIQNVMMRMERVSVKAGDEVVKQGDKGCYFFLINRGRCAVTCKHENTAEAEELACLGPGDNFGEEALLSDSLRGCSVTMLTDGVLFRLGREDFTAFIKRPLTKDVDYEEACKIVAAGGLWLDVRDPADHQRNGLEGSINIPLHSLRFQIDSLTPDHQYVVYCADGNQSAVAAFLLFERGINVVVLKDGIDRVSHAEKGVADDEPSELQQDSELSVDISKLTKEQNDTQKQVALLEKNLHKTTEKYEQIQRKLVTNISTLKQVVQDLKSKLAAAQESLAAQENSGADEVLIEKVAKLEHEIAERDKKIKQLNSKQRQQDAEMEILLEASEENDKAGLAEVMQLKGQVNDLQQQLKAAKGEG